jgi:2-oxoglutarate ferredoxin oxidoreductase subunit alpha
VARICKTAIDTLKTQGVKAALFRPITLFPYPGDALAKAALQAKHVLVSEMSCGQMVEDARYHVAGKRPVAFYGRVGGMIMTPEELVDEALKLVGKSG